MIGLALSGGGSRAIAFHLGCLRALNDLGILGDVGVISTISGGSVIGAYYAYSPQRSFCEFEDDVRRILRKGFHRALVREALAPWNAVAGLGSLFSAALYYAGLLGKTLPQRYPSRTDLFQLRETKVTERFTEHDLRAKCASDAESLEHARAMLAHADARTTELIYRRRPERVHPAR